MRATAANGICCNSIGTGASNSKVKPDRRPAKWGATRRTEPLGNFTRGKRTCR